MANKKKTYLSFFKKYLLNNKSERDKYSNFKKRLDKEWIFY